MCAMRVNCVQNMTSCWSTSELFMDFDNSLLFFVCKGPLYLDLFFTFGLCAVLTQRAKDLDSGQKSTQCKFMPQKYKILHFADLRCRIYAFWYKCDLGWSHLHLIVILHGEPCNVLPSEQNLPFSRK